MSYSDAIESPIRTGARRRPLFASAELACEHSLEHWIAVQHLVEEADNEASLTVSTSDLAAEASSLHRKPSGSESLRCE